MRGWGWVLDVDMRIWEMKRWGSGSGYRIRGDGVLGLDIGYEATLDCAGDEVSFI